jgi:hypothetical protein
VVVPVGSPSLCVRTITEEVTLRPRVLTSASELTLMSTKCASLPETHVPLDKPDSTTTSTAAYIAATSAWIDELIASSVAVNPLRSRNFLTPQRLPRRHAPDVFDEFVVNTVGSASSYSPAPVEAVDLDGNLFSPRTRAPIGKSSPMSPQPLLRRKSSKSLSLQTALSPVLALSSLCLSPPSARAPMRSPIPIDAILNAPASPMPSNNILEHGAAQGTTSAVDLIAACKILLPSECDDSQSVCPGDDAPHLHRRWPMQPSAPIASSSSRSTPSSFGNLDGVEESSPRPPPPLHAPRYLRPTFTNNLRVPQPPAARALPMLSPKSTERYCALSAARAAGEQADGKNRAQTPMSRALSAATAIYTSPVAPLRPPQRGLVLSGPGVSSHSRHRPMNLGRTSRRDSSPHQVDELPKSRLARFADFLHDDAETSGAPSVAIRRAGLSLFPAVSQAASTVGPMEEPASEPVSVPVVGRTLFIKRLQRATDSPADGGPKDSLPSRRCD